MNKGKRKDVKRSVEHQADFKKLHRKVGKKAPVKANVTNTNFATRSINVPSQKLLSDNTSTSLNALHDHSALTNARHLNLHDLLLQLHHYNANVRRDALIGLKDFFTRHTQVVHREAAVVLSGIMPTLLDEEKSVRVASLTFLQFFLSHFSSSTSSLQPFLRLFTSYIGSGLSHMHFAVKRSAFQALKYIMDQTNGKHHASTSTSSSSSSSSSASAATNLLLWQYSHQEFLPNFLSCIIERIYTTKQSNMATTEHIASQGGRNSRGGYSTTSAAAMSSGTNANASNDLSTNLMNRALMLQCIEQYLNLCPFVQQQSSQLHLSDSSATSIPAAQLHASSLHTLIYPDPAVVATPAASGGSVDPFASSPGLLGTSVVASTLLMSSAPSAVPLKYARKQNQQNKFLQATADAAAGATLTSRHQLLHASLVTFLQQLLPVLIEYWLESFGLVTSSSAAASSSASSSGHASSLSSAFSAAGLSARLRSCSDLLSNSLAIIKLIHTSLRILKSVRRERRHARWLESGSYNLDGDDEDEVDESMEFDTSLLPRNYLSLLRTHIFSSFPFSISSFTSLPLASTQFNDHQYRLMNQINVECMHLITGFIHKQSTHRSRAVSSPEDAQSLSTLLSYLIDAFQFYEQMNVEKKKRDSNDQIDDKQVKHEESNVDEDEDEEQSDEEDDDKDEEPADEDNDMKDDDDEEAAPRKKQKVASSSAAPVLTRPSPSFSPSTPQEYPSFSDLFPLLQSLFSRFTRQQQQKFLQIFTPFYLNAHPLSNTKFMALVFLYEGLVHSHSGSSHKSNIWWHDVELRTNLWGSETQIGELLNLFQILAAAIGHQRTIISMKQEQEAAAAACESDDNNNSAPAAPSSLSPSTYVTSPLIQRYTSMFHVLLQLFLHVARRSGHSSSHSISYELLQPQLVPFFGQPLSSSDPSNPQPVLIIPGPFWHLPLQLQQSSLQLLGYFQKGLSEQIIQIFLGCIRNQLAYQSQLHDTSSDSSSASPPPPLSYESKKLVLDFLEEKLHDSNGNGIRCTSYLSFILSVIRTDTHRSVLSAQPTAAFSFESVSDLFPIAARMIRGVTALDLQQAIVDASAVQTPTLIDVLSPMLINSLQATPAAASPLNFPSAACLLEVLLAHHDGDVVIHPLPHELVSIMPMIIFRLLSASLQSSDIEAGAMGILAAHNWLSSPLQFRASDANFGTTQKRQMWLLGMRLLYYVYRNQVATGTASDSLILPLLLHLMEVQLQNAKEEQSSNIVQVIVVFIGLINSNIPVSPTLLSLCRAELTLLFGQRVN